MVKPSHVVVLVLLLAMALSSGRAALALTLFGVGAGVAAGTGVSYTLDSIAYETFTASQGQIPSNVKNPGQLVSGKYQTMSVGTTITTASGKSQAVGNSGKHDSGSESDKGYFGADTSSSNASGRHSRLSSHGGGHGK